MGEESSSAVIGEVEKNCDEQEDWPDYQKNGSGDKKVKKAFEIIFIHLANYMSPQEYPIPF